MTIGIDASRANLKRKTGTEWYSFYLIKNLAKIDKENKYLLYLNDLPSSELQEIIKDNPNFSVKFLHWPFLSFWTLGRLTLEMIFHKPDILFIPAHTMPLVYPKRTINTIHDIAFARDRNLYQSKGVKTDRALSKKIVEFLVRLFTLGKYHSESLDYLYWSTDFALRRAKKIITVSNFTKQDILSFYPRAKANNITVIHNGYNDDLYKMGRDQEKIKAKLEKYNLEQPYFLYVGRLEKKKNTPALIEALSIMHDSHPEIKEKLVLIGDASFGYDEVKYVIEEFNLNNEVLMPGWVAEEDMPCIFNGASAFIFPSKHEGFGIPILQAMACGLPVACSDIPVFKEVAADAVLYFNHEDKKAIAEAMAKIINNRELHQELIKKGLERAQNFSWQKCAEETLKEILST
ncbi:MAG: glycosyltransferase family 1 protein [Patescibacteria group bacterium]|jgi:glycosyltransferase involved in cell wall biosynthesis